MTDSIGSRHTGQPSPRAFKTRAQTKQQAIEEDPTENSARRGKDGAFLLASVLQSAKQGTSAKQDHVLPSFAAVADQAAK